MRTQGLLLATTMLFGMCSLLVQARAQSKEAGQGTSPTPAMQGQTPETSDEGALALGKKIFVERCAKCHGEDGKKPVGDGLALSERKLSDEALTRMVRGRLKSSPEREQKAVTAYIRSIQKK